MSSNRVEPVEEAVWIILPVKDAKEAKQRLSPLLSAGQRRELCQAMLEDVLAEVSQVKGVAGVLVISNDPAVQSLEVRFPVHTRLEPQDNAFGLNGAVTDAARYLAEQGADAVLVLHGDIPMIDSAELERVLAHHRSQGPGAHITLTPDDEQDGTNVLLVSPPLAIPYAYGKNSFSRHCQLASERNLRVDVVSSAALALDIDTPDDLACFASHCANSPRLAGRHSWRLLQNLPLAPVSREDEVSVRSA